MRSITTAALALCVLAVGGCTEIENTLAEVPFLAFMHSSPSFDPYEAPRPAPEHSVPVRSPFGDAPYAEGNAQPQLLELASRVTNPGADAEDLAHGQLIYLRHCSVCHGPSGEGNGPIVRTPPDGFPMGPALTTPTVGGYSDGYIYAVVRQGRGLMPAYGPRMTERERWQVVNYVRSLAQASGAAPADAGGAAGAANTSTTSSAAGTPDGASAAADTAASGSATPQQ